MKNYSFSHQIVSVCICFFGGNMYRIINGYDQCGNICGRENDPDVIDGIVWDYKAEDMTSLPFTKIIEENWTSNKKKCVDQCGDGYYPEINRCFKLSDKINAKIAEETVHIISTSMKPISLSVLFSIIFSAIILVLFRYAIKQIIWGIYIGIASILILIGLFCLGTYYASEGIDHKGGKFAAETISLILSVAFLSVGIALATVIYLFRRRIRLVVELFKEASKVFADETQLLLQPVLTLITIILSVMIFGFFHLIIESSGNLEKASIYYNFLEYRQGGKEKFSHHLNYFVFYWFMNFILGCQHFIIASTVCQWYFSREKSELKSVMKRAFYQLLKFHIGTICLGSFLIIIVKVILTFFRYLCVS